MLKAEAECLRSAWVIALRDVAKELGFVPSMGGEGTSGNAVVRILGPVAWSRHKYERCADDSKDRAVRGVGYLEGLRDAALRAARELEDREADRLLTDVPSTVQRMVYG